MALLTQEQLDLVEKTISNIEQQTDAELVTVLARRADGYLYIPTLWAAVIALLLPLSLRLTPFWLDGDDLLWLQWLCFVVFALLFRIPFFTQRLVPKPIKYLRAANLARRQFLENNVHLTKGHTGVLIFVAEAEHYVEIIADQGINDKVTAEAWQQIVNAFIDAVKQGQTHAGFIRCIEDCGELLKRHVPLTESKNELPNHLVLL